MVIPDQCRPVWAEHCSTLVLPGVHKKTSGFFMGSWYMCMLSHTNVKEIHTLLWLQYKAVLLEVQLNIKSSNYYTCQLNTTVVRLYYTDSRTKIITVTVWWHFIDIYTHILYDIAYGISWKRNKGDFILEPYSILTMETLGKNEEGHDEVTHRLSTRTWMEANNLILRNYYKK